MRSIAICLIAAFLIAIAPAQTETPPEPDYEQLVQDLGSLDFQTRESATAALKKAGAAARPALAKALSSSDLEQRTRARRLLDALDAGGGRVDAQAERDRVRGERLKPIRPGSSVPRPRVEVRPQRRRLPRLEDFGGRLDEYMKALDSFLDETRQIGPSLGEIENILRTRMPSFELSTRGGVGITTRVVKNDESLSLTRGTDGKVTFRVVRIDRSTGQSGESQVYTGSSMADFKHRHPAVYEEYRDTGLFDASRNGFVFTTPRQHGMRPVPPERRTSRPAPRRSTHGVLMQVVPAVLRSHVDIPDRAVVVARVDRGSWAAGFGFQAHDVVTHVDGLAVGTPGAFARMLELGATDEVTVEVIRRARPVTLSGQRPH